MQDVITAGTTLNQTTTVAGYPPSDGWTLKMRLVPRNAAHSVQEITAGTDGDLYLVQASAATTANWSAGSYSWHTWVEKGAEKYPVADGQMVVKDNPITMAAGADTRSQARKALDQARDAFAAWMPTRRRFKIGDREQEFNTAAEILAVIRYWELQVDREQSSADPVVARINSGRFYIRATR